MRIANSVCVVFISGKLHHFQAEICASHNALHTQFSIKLHRRCALSCHYCRCIHMCRHIDYLTPWKSNNFVHNWQISHLKIFILLHLRSHAHSQMPNQEISVKTWITLSFLVFFFFCYWKWQISIFFFYFDWCHNRNQYFDIDESENRRLKSNSCCCSLTGAGDTLSAVANR